MEWPLSKEELEYLYWDKWMLQKEIADFFDKSKQIISYWFRKYDIKPKYYKNKKTDECFSKEIEQAVGDEYIFLEKYKGAMNKIKVRHQKCGYTYKVKPNNFLQGRRCPKCAGNIKKTTNKFKKEVKEITDGQYKVLGKYTGALEKIKLKHYRCNKEFKMKASTFLNGSRCPHCAGKRKTTKSFKQEIKELVGYQYTVLGKYKGAKSKIKIKHNKCGYIYKVTPSNFLNGRRCPKCKGIGSSSGEKIINIFLKTNNIKSIYEYSHKKCRNKYKLSFDFKIKGKPILIEYNGRQHYKPVKYFGGKNAFEQQKINDKIKKDFCKENNIKLIIIPYWEKDNIEEILKKELKEVM